MEEREELIIQSVARLRSIKSAEEYKAAKEDIMKIMEKLIQTGVESLQDFLENMFTMDPEEREEKAKKFQDDSYILDPRIGIEMERLDSYPGADEFADEFEEEFERRLGPFMEQYAEKGAKLMESLMGNFAEEIAEAFVPQAEEEEEKTEEQFVFDSNNPDTPQMLYDLYAAQSLEELKENKDNLIETLEEQMQSDIWELEVLTDIEFMPTLEEGDQKKIEDILHRMRRFKPEMEKEFARIAALPDAAEKAGEVQKEIMDRLNPKVREIKRHLAKPWKR